MRCWPPRAPPPWALLLLLLLVGLLSGLLTPAFACIWRLPAVTCGASDPRSSKPPLYLEASTASAARRFALLPIRIEDWGLLKLLRMLEEELTDRKSVCSRCRIGSRMLDILAVSVVTKVAECKALLSGALRGQHRYALQGSDGTEAP